jgi:hypothetical protein
MLHNIGKYCAFIYVLSSLIVIIIVFSFTLFRGTLQLQEMVHCRWVEDITQVQSYNLWKLPIT